MKYSCLFSLLAASSKAVCEWVHSMTLMFSEGSSPCKLGDALPVQAATSTSPSIPHPEVQLPRELTPDTQVRSEKQAAEIDMGDHVRSVHKEVHLYNKN